MTDSFVLHLQSESLAGGEVRGVVDIVATGERRTVTTAAELLELLRRHADRLDGRDRRSRQAGLTPVD